MQTVSVTGRLGADPVMREANGKAVANFPLASTERWTKDGQPQKRTEWFKCVAFSPLAEVIGHHLKKGEEFSVVGKMKTDTYVKDGETKYSTSLMIDHFEFRSSGVMVDAGPKATPAPEDYDDDIPF